jgi:hypothetical protein
MARTPLTQTMQNGQMITYRYDIPRKKRTVTSPGSRAITEYTDFPTRMDHIDDARSPSSIVQYTYDLAITCSAVTTATARHPCTPTTRTAGQPALASEPRHLCGIQLSGGRFLFGNVPGANNSLFRHFKKAYSVATS